MYLKPHQNTQLYGMNRSFKEIVDLFNKGKMPNKILVSGKKGIGKSTLAYHVVNYILSKDEEFHYNQQEFIINSNNKSYRLIQNNTHPNFYLIDLFEEKKSIDIGQIREMISYTNKSSFNKLPRFILLDNIENLNKNSVNALLKIIEDPNDNIFFMLIHNNEKTILPTLNSRCIKFKVNFSHEKSLEITKKIFGEDIFKSVHTELSSFYTSPGEFINLINFANEKKIDLKKYNLKKFLTLLIENGYYKKNKVIKVLLLNFIELFFFNKYKFSKTKSSLLILYQEFVSKINNTEKFNLDEESLFLEFKSKLLND